MMAKLVGVLIMILRREHTSTYGITLKGKGQGQGQGRAKQSSRLYHLKVMKKHLKPY
jgi:hypothetical protein